MLSPRGGYAVKRAGLYERYRLLSPTFLIKRGGKIILLFSVENNCADSASMTSCPLLAVVRTAALVCTLFLTFY